MRWILLGIVGCFASVTTTAEAADWMFEHSYYSHRDSPAYTMGVAPRSRSAYRKPVISTHPSFAIRQGYRYNTIGIYNGQSTDRTVIREGWFDIDN